MKKLGRVGQVVSFRKKACQVSQEKGGHMLSWGKFPEKRSLNRKTDGWVGGGKRKGVGFNRNRKGETKAELTEDFAKCPIKPKNWSSFEWTIRLKSKDNKIRTRQNLLQPGETNTQQKTKNCTRKPASKIETKPAKGVPGERHVKRGKSVKTKTNFLFPRGGLQKKL